MLRSEQYIVKPGFESVMTRRGVISPGMNLPPDMNDREIAGLLERNLIMPDHKAITGDAKPAGPSWEELNTKFQETEKAKVLDTPTTEAIFSIISAEQERTNETISESFVQTTESEPSPAELLRVDADELPELPVKETIELGDSENVIVQEVETPDNHAEVKKRRGRKARKN